MLLRPSLLLLCCMMLYSCSYDYGRYSHSEGKEMKNNLQKHKMMQEWYNALVARENAPIYVVEVPVINSDENRKGNFFKYILVDLVTEEMYDLNPTFNTGTADGDGGVWAPNPLDEYKDQFLKKYDRISIINKLHQEGLDFTKTYALIPILTDSIIENADSVDYNRKIEIEVKLTEENFRFSNEFRELVASKKYSANFSVNELPKILIDSVNSRFNYLKSFVPDQYYSKIKSANLIIADTSEVFEPQSLWLKNEDGNVFMSSILLRALLIDQISFHGYHILDFTHNKLPLPNDKPLYYLKYDSLKLSAIEAGRNISAERFSKNVEVKIAYDSFFDALYTGLDFLFLHELAHIYLGNLGLNESRCDCHAYQALKRMKPNADLQDLGIFYTYLLNQGERQSSFWYGNPDPVKFKELTIRAKKLETLHATGSTQCN